MASSGGTEGPSSASVPASANPRLALLSVSDKTGADRLAHALVRHGYRLISTGGTARMLQDSGLDVTEVSDYTGFPEIMDGRVKSLHPRIHGGLLGREGTDDAVMAEHGIRRINILVLNLYPFEKATARPDCTEEEAIENIDIGGPAMLRSAAKNYRSVVVVTDPKQYDDVIEALDKGDGQVDEAMRLQLARSAFDHVTRYDAAISDWFGSTQASTGKPEFPPWLKLRLVKKQSLRYGENPHQRAAWYRQAEPAPGTICEAKQLQGKELSFNNISDADAAWQCVLQFAEPACVIVKHANPCGVATANSLRDAYRRAFETDPTSAFGGIIAFNREVDERLAAAVVNGQFVELIIAPAYSEDARARIGEKANVRLLQLEIVSPTASSEARSVSGGMLVQSADTGTVSREDCRVVGARPPDEAEWANLLFAWRVARLVKSNAIVYAADGRTLGVGAGQMSRVDSARIGAWKARDAGLSLAGCAMASDAFFPFRDGIDAAAGHGVGAVIQPGGSVRDAEVIEAANEHGIAMVFTGMRHFRH